ncbi:DUF4190 domain-containing protein [Actinomycetospora chiangmaiensis]|uniref:DUF4190 domain-containing protein n=1 Tax=Actinomycetospora chiangmaiensis TaxID=402650 RepID=UPI00036BBD5C|nr:DUF4190 domain-containing protein [Actinomycetospora chiangmaiensis]
MTQHLDRPVTPMIDPSVDAVTTTPAGGTPQVQNPGWPPPGSPVTAEYPGHAASPGHAAYPGHPGHAAPAGTVPGVVAPEPPLNTLSWLSVVSAFIVSPVAILLGAIARRQIRRTGERGRGLATTGIALGIVFTLMGIISTILVLSMVTTVTYTPAAPAPAPVAAAPSPAAAPAASAPSPSSGSSTGQADLLSAYLDLVAANQTLNADFGSHTGDLAAMKQDLATYRAAVQTFRDKAAAADVPAAQRSQIDGTLVPAVDKVLADLDAIAGATGQKKLESAAGDFDTDNPAMVQAASTVIGG